MLYDVTFTRRFWRGKHMVVCEQTSLRAVVLVGCFNTLRARVQYIRTLILA